MRVINGSASNSSAGAPNQPAGDNGRRIISGYGYSTPPFGWP